MDPKEYIKNVLITEARDFAPLQERFSQIRNIRLLHGAIGLASELAEIREMARDNDYVDKVNLLEEMGDLFWYMGIIVDELGIDPNQIFRTKQVKAVLWQFPDLAASNELSTIIDTLTICIGYMIDIFKKSLMYGKEIDVETVEGILQEMGIDIEDALNAHGYTSNDARQINIDKLRARYGEKFTEAAALNRDLETERKILEQK